MKHLLIISVFLFSVLNLISQIPDGYYDSAEGLTGEELREELKQIIDNHDSQSYSSLWDHFQLTDKKENGKVWDMYSTDNEGNFDYEYTFEEDQCGNYSGEGSCYNREHSVPASWYNDAYPMYSDLFHLYPTDGWTNGIRSNHPFGEVDNPSVTTSNGSKRGANTYPGYTGIVFEPIDEYKGDFARTYFYIVTRYKDQVSGWNSNAFDGENLSEWQRNMLLEWHWNDPVSSKETNRNNEVYLIQENRNPFIDHPEWVDEIWESTSHISSKNQIGIELSVVNGELNVLGNWKELSIYTSQGTLISSHISGEIGIAVPRDQILIICVHSGQKVHFFRIVSMTD